MLASMQVQHEIDQRPLEARARASEQGEPGAGNLGRTIDIQDSEGAPKVDVIQGLKIEFWRRSPPADLGVCTFIRSDGYGFVRKIRNSPGPSPRGT